VTESDLTTNWYVTNLKSRVGIRGEAPNFGPAASLPAVVLLQS